MHVDLFIFYLFHVQLSLLIRACYVVIQYKRETTLILGCEKRPDTYQRPKIVPCRKKMEKWNQLIVVLSVSLCQAQPLLFFCFLLFKISKPNNLSTAQLIAPHSELTHQYSAAIKRHATPQSWQVKRGCLHIAKKAAFASHPIIDKADFYWTKKS